MAKRANFGHAWVEWQEYGPRGEVIFCRTKPDAAIALAKEAKPGLSDGIALREFCSTHWAWRKPRKRQGLAVAINYGSIEPSQRARKPRAKTLIDYKALASNDEPVSAEELETILLQLSRQKRAPAVAKSAAAELLERIKPRKVLQDPGITGADAARIADIYERLFGKGCPKCGYEWNENGQE